MNGSDDTAVKAGLSRRWFGKTLAAGLGSIAVLPGLKRFFKSGPRGSLREADFYETLDRGREKQ